MTDQAMSPLRRHMIEDMTVRNFVAKTQSDYIRRVKNFAVFLGRTPDRASREDVRRYLLHLASSGVGAGTVNGTGSALRFFFDVTLDRADIVRHLLVTREPRKAPIVLSPEEVARMLEAAPGLKYKAALSVAYGAGLRVSEVVALKVSDIDSARMMIRIEQSKRRKDRYAMLSPRLLDLLRDWWLVCRSRGWLFPGRDPLQPITTRQLTRACHTAAQAGGAREAPGLSIVGGGSAFASTLLDATIVCGVRKAARCSSEAADEARPVRRSVSTDYRGIGARGRSLGQAMVGNSRREYAVQCRDQSAVFRMQRRPVVDGTGGGVSHTAISYVQAGNRGRRARQKRGARLPNLFCEAITGKGRRQRRSRTAHSPDAAGVHCFQHCAV